MRSKGSGLQRLRMSEMPTEVLFRMSLGTRISAVHQGRALNTVVSNNKLCKLLEISDVPPA